MEEKRQKQIEEYAQYEQKKDELTAKGKTEELKQLEEPLIAIEIGKLRGEMIQVIPERNGEKEYIFTVRPGKFKGQLTCSEAAVHSALKAAPR